MRYGVAFFMSCLSRADDDAKAPDFVKEVQEREGTDDQEADGLGGVVDLPTIDGVVTTRHDVTESEDAIHGESPLLIRRNARVHGRVEPGLRREYVPLGGHDLGRCDVVRDVRDGSGRGVRALQLDA